MWIRAPRAGVWETLGGTIAFVALLFVLLPSAWAGAEETFPGRQEATALVRQTLVRLNDANLRGDYSVLRSKSAPAFQDRFSLLELEELFRGMREKRVDLTEALADEPELTRARFHTGQAVLQYVGIVHSRPIEVRFEFSYQNIGGTWRLYGLDLNFEPATNKKVAEPRAI